MPPPTDASVLATLASTQQRQSQLLLLLREHGGNFEGTHALRARRVNETYQI